MRKVSDVSTSTAVIHGDTTSVGDVIRELRLVRGWTQKQLAKKAGLTERTISNLEREAHPRRYDDTIIKVALALEIAPERLDAKLLAEPVTKRATPKPN